jgi:murein DD-endopeptidase MepM/ murein hydrolase activator NlpD
VTSDVQGIGVGAGSDTAPAASSAQREKLTALAHQFESMLIVQMLRDMRRTVADEGEEGPGFGAATMNETVETELGNALSRAGGFGLADLMLRALDRQDLAERPTPPEDAGSGGSVPADALAIPAGSRSSEFGWRADPINGQQRFHAGVDIRLAYGQDVRAAAGGRVVAAGEQHGYGLTVVVDHGQGVQTRYAHLSEATVAVGDLVDSGQLVARSGSSGRSTGPHLHFEVRKDGRAVDPETAIQGFRAAAD